ncbi:MAG: hypothetical protein SFZ23_15570 [Planctomycetota bacterium]|nr:hypothetical protein [Planctomycetota bacterium]
MDARAFAYTILSAAEGGHPVTILCAGGAVRITPRTLVVPEAHVQPLSPVIGKFQATHFQRTSLEAYGVIGHEPDDASRALTLTIDPSLVGCVVRG